MSPTDQRIGGVTHVWNCSRAFACHAVFSRLPIVRREDQGTQLCHCRRLLCKGCYDSQDQDVNYLQLLSHNPGFVQEPLAVKLNGLDTVINVLAFANEESVRHYLPC